MTFGEKNVEPVAWQWRSRVKGGAWDAWERGRYGGEVPPFMDVEERALVPASALVERDSEIARLRTAVELLRKLEGACDAAAGTRSQATYDQMISDHGAEDALDDLDIARREARAYLDPSLHGMDANGQR